MTMLNNTQSNLLGGATDAVLSMRDVKVHYPVKEGLLQQVTGYVRAVDGVSLSIPRGQTLGLVGESGCGKTTLGRVISGLVAPTNGELWVDVSPEDQKEIDRLSSLSPKEIGQADQATLKRLKENHLLGSMSKEKQRQYRRNCQVVFQDAFSSLNPRQLVRDIVGRPLRVHREASGDDLDEKVVELLEKVGLGRQHLLRYPHQFSGGQRQRISIARALALNPEFVVLDEPTSALDVSVQAQILNLLVELQKDMGLTYLFITHDLGVVQHMADSIAVMYLGQIAEFGPTADVFNNPLHPYTRILRDSNPSLEDDDEREKWDLSGTVPNPINPPRGCRLHPRCPLAKAECGWSVDDVLTDTERHAPVLFETITRVQRSSDFSARIEFDQADSATQFATRVGQLSAHDALDRPVAVEGASVDMSFVEVSDAELEQMQEGRWSSCTRTQQLGALPELDSNKSQ